MFHPQTEIRRINPEIGYGVFATAFIPKGTIVYVEDPFEIRLTPQQFEALDLPYKEIAEKYSYTNEMGIRVISWDIAKYVNHRCECNTMSTAYDGLEIAIQDILPGEEMTDEYGLFNMEEDMAVSCNCQNCRKVIRPDDIDVYYQEWDRRIMDALAHFSRVTQPLLSYLGSQTIAELMRYINGETDYKSVLSLKNVLQVYDSMSNVA